jgi:molybdopterin molybdotransferase
MISVSEATSIIHQHLYAPKKETVDLMKTNGRILAETVKADRDLPPFNRATMDGIAIQFDSFGKGNKKFKLEGLLAAGEPTFPLTDSSGALEIMTGAVLPSNTDTVIRYEDIAIENGSATVKVDSIEKGQSIHRQGSDAKRNEVLLEAGLKISPAEIALLASVGKSTVEVFAYPKTAIISTGNELVDINQTPELHQIRKSNSYALQAALLTTGCESDLFHLPDEKSILEKELNTILKDYELIILSGGVSKGKFDFVPAVLESVGIQKQFHQVSQRPGKPFWFGVSKQHTVFALPGNPVSTYMCFYKYIQPWLMKSMLSPQRTSLAALGTNFSFSFPLTYFLQVRIENRSGKLIAYPNAGGGSGDFANLKNVDGFLELPPERNEFTEGEVFPYYSFRQS